MKSAEALFGAIAAVFNIGNDPKPDPADHECVFKPEGGDRVKLVKCSVEGCGNYGRPDDDGKYTKLFNEYKDFEDRKDEIFTFCDKYLENLSKVDRYDPEKHAYEEGSKLEKESEKAVKMSDKLEEYYHYVSDVYSVVELFYYSDVSEYGELYRAAEGADCVLCGCAKPAGFKGPHMAGDDAVKFAQETGVKIIATHFAPSFDAEKDMPKHENIVLAEEGKTYYIN